MTPRPYVFSVAVVRIEPYGGESCLYLATEERNGRGAGREQWIPLWGVDPWTRWVESTAAEHDVSHEEAERICAAVPGAEKVRALS